MKTANKYIKKTNLLPSPLVAAITLALTTTATAQDHQTDADNDSFSATLPTVEVEAMSEEDITKGYVITKDAAVTRNNQSVKETPQSIETISIQKNKNYGTRDLSSILEGNAGVDTKYDMRADYIYLRGFRSDLNDTYRDGVRESGQIHRSTTNIERIEVLKGPASLLYGRSNGGGIINMVSKQANFDTHHEVSIGYGSYANREVGFDFNQAINDNVAVRLVGEYNKANSFRSGIDSESYMLSPSITFDSGEGLTWTGQYTYDYAYRVPDRGPTKDVYDEMDISYDQAFARPGDYVKDTLHSFRSDLNLELSDNWSLNWLAAYRNSSQDFDHYYSGSFDEDTQLLTQNYAWQQTDNTTLSSSLTANGNFFTGSIEHDITIGLDLSRETREPYVGYERNYSSIDPYDSSTWVRDGSPETVAANFDNIHKAHSQEFFIQDVISLTPTFKLVLGGGYNKYTFKSTALLSDSEQSYSGDSFSPSVGLVWEATDNHTLYTSYNKSFAPYGGKGSSVLGVSTSTDSSEFNEEPEYNEQYEVGIKSDWMDDRLSTTLAVYNIEHNNIRYQPDDDDPYTWATRGKERSRGIELSAIGEIAPKWYLRASLGYMDAKVIEDNDNPDNVGHHLTNTANFNGNVFVRYAATDNLYGELGLTHVGKRYYYSSGDEYTLGSYNRVDALIGWKDKDWSATLGVKNLLDEDYWRSDSMPGDPRTFTARFTYEF